MKRPKESYNQGGHLNNYADELDEYIDWLEKFIYYYTEEGIVMEIEDIIAYEEIVKRYLK